MATGLERGSAAAQPDAVIIDEGFLIQRTGVNPRTGEAWKPCWVIRRDCPSALLTQWNEKRSIVSSGEVKQEADDTPKLLLNSGIDVLRKRTASVSVKQEQEEIKVEDGGDRKRQKSERWTAPQVAAHTSSQPSKVSVQRGRNRSTTVSRPSLDPPKWGPSRSGVSSTDTDSAELPSGDASSTQLHSADSTFELAVRHENWLLFPEIRSKRGMLVVIQGSHGDGQKDGWYNGDLEGARGVILMVFVSGSSIMPPVARVKMLNPRDESEATLTIPVVYLWPVEPDEPGQNVLMLQGDHRGEVGKVREEDEIGWFISVGKMHCTVAAENLERILEVDEDDNILNL